MDRRVVFSGWLLPAVLLLPQLAVTVIFFFWPAGQAIVQSVQGGDAFGLSTRFVGWDNFATVFADPNYIFSFGVTALFIGRILYRVTVLYSMTSSMGTGKPAPAPDNNPLTLGILFLTAGYYIVYCTGLLRWLRTAQSSPGAKLAPAAPDGA